MFEELDFFQRPLVQLYTLMPRHLRLPFGLGFPAVFLRTGQGIRHVLFGQ